MSYKTYRLHTYYVDGHLLFDFTYDAPNNVAWCVSYSVHLFRSHGERSQVARTLRQCEICGFETIGDHKLQVTLRQVHNETIKRQLESLLLIKEVVYNMQLVFRTTW